MRKSTFGKLKAGQFFTFPNTNGNNDIFMRIDVGFVRIPNKYFSFTGSWDEDYCKNMKNSDVNILCKSELFNKIRMVK